MKPRTKFIIAVCFALPLLCPISITISPPSKIRIMDSTGTPVSNMVVYESWEHFGSGASGYEEKHTDEDGYVIFERHSARVIPLGQIFHLLLPLISPHESNGTTVSFDIQYTLSYKPVLNGVGTPSNIKSDSPDGVYVDRDETRASLSYYNRHKAIEFTVILQKTLAK